MNIDTSDERKFGIVTVLGATFDTFFRRFFLYFSLSLIVAIPLLASRFMFSGTDLFDGRDLDLFRNNIPQRGFVHDVIYLYFGSLMAAFVTSAVIAEIHGQNIRRRKAFSTAFSRLIPIVLISSITFIMLSPNLPDLPWALLEILWGVLLIFVMLVFWVAIPVIIAEGKGPLNAIGRSAALTRGHRWSIFGIVVTITLFFGIAYAVSSLVEDALMPDPLDGGPAFLSWAADMLSILFDTLFDVFLMISAAHSYIYLRFLKEGPNAGDLAKVFE